MKITFELEDDEDGFFHRVEFRANAENIYRILCERANRFLYPFINDNPDLAAMAAEMAEGCDERQFVEMLDLMRWELKDLELLKIAIESQITQRT